MPPSLRAGLLVLVLTSPAAYAQTITLGFAGSNSATTTAINQADCNAGNSVRVTWQVASIGTACNNLQIFVTNGSSCPDTPNVTSTDGGTATDQIIGTVSISDLVQGSGTLDAFTISSMPGLGGSCPDGVDITNAVCASLNYRPVGATSCTALTSSNSLTLRYDAKPPSPPTMSLLTQDSAIVVQVGNNGESGLSAYRIEYAPLLSASDAGLVWTTPPDLLATKTSLRIDGLVNGQTYSVRARSLDEVQNLSAYTAEQTATPQASNGFWGEYQAAGGHELGGCSAADATVPSIVAALAVLATLLWRRR
jgi:uncharacterized protein (TIGR03382 family)